MPLSQFRHNIQAERDHAMPTGEDLQLNQLNLYTPQGEAILQNVQARINSGKWTQLAGQSGLGKSTLLRTISGLWVDYDGDWQRPHGSSLLLPQKPTSAKARSPKSSATLAKPLLIPTTPRCWRMWG